MIKDKGPNNEYTLWMSIIFTTSLIVGMNVAIFKLLSIGASPALLSTVGNLAMIARLPLLLYYMPSLFDRLVD